MDGVDAKEHANRFQIGGKYHPSLEEHSQFALVDFRQSSV